MSNVPQTLALITLAQEFRGDVVGQINRRVTLLKLLRIVPGGGQNVAWVARSDGHLAENHTDGQDVSNYGSDAQTSAILTWSLYRSPFSVTKLAMDAAAGAASPLGNRALWRENMANAAAKLADKIEKELFVGPGTGTTISGLDLAIGSTTSTYATISQSSNTFWQPYVIDPGSATGISFQQIRTDLAAIQAAGGEVPDIAVCGLSTFNSIAGLFDANRRWTSVNTARGKIQLDAGFEGVEVDGCMFVKAKDAPEGAIYYLNTRYTEIQYLPDATYPPYVYEQVQADDGYGSVPLGFHYEMLAKTGPADKAEILSEIALKVGRPNTCGKRLHVAYG